MESKTENLCDDKIAIEQIDRSFLVSASAGTGKTRVLVNRAINILQRTNTTINELVAITFTEKAAAEMKERIRYSLRSLNQSTANIGENLLDQLNSAPISTIHSFCARVLQENSEEIGIDPQFRIIDEVEELILRKETLENFLHKELNKPDSPVQALMNYFDLLHIREMLNILWQNQVDFAELLKINSTSTQTDIYSQTKHYYQQYTLTLLQEAFSTNAVVDACKFLELHNASDSDDKLHCAKTILLNAIEKVKNGRIPGELRDGSLSKAFSLNNRGQKSKWGNELEEMREKHHFLRSVWDSIKDRLFAFDDELEQKNASLLVNFSQIALLWIDYYRKVLNSESAVDFNGLEILTEIFFKSKSETARAYANRFKHLLVDEFQDISPVQDRILTAICSLNPSLITFYVGDEKQSIYRFRGAEVEIFNGYRHQKPLLYLAKNYRSIKALNDFFNYFFEFLFNRPETVPEYDVRYDKPVDSHDKTKTKNTPVQLLLVKPDEGDDETFSGLSEIDAEFINVINGIKNLCGQEIIKNKDGFLRKPEWRDFTILLRSRTHQENLERVLNQAGVPYYVSSGVGFYERREVLDVLNFLRILINWYDEVALIGTLRSPMIGMSDDTLMALATENGLMDGIQKLINKDKEYQKSLDSEIVVQFQKFLDLYNQIHEKMTSLTTAELLQTILESTGYLAVLAAFPDEKQSIANVLKLVDLAIEWSISQDISPIDYIRRIQLYQSMQVREGEANLSSEIENSITIMTIHAAKGLAFPIVVIPELAAKRRSSYSRLLCDNSGHIAFSLKTVFDDNRGFYYQLLSQIERDREAAEEKRILYVAATRAESYLLLSAINKSATGSGSLWSNLKSFFSTDNSGVQISECSMSEAVELYAGFQKDSTDIQQPLTSDQKEQIQRLIRPLPVRKQFKKVTPTAFAAWINRTLGEIPSYEKYQFTGNIFESVTSLSALEIGTIIHQAFAWWDFRKIEMLSAYTEQLMKPYSIDVKEEQKMQELFVQWGQKFLHAENALSRYIEESVAVFREIDISAWLFDTLIEGKIDLLLKTKNDQYIIVDFKSDHIRDYPDSATMTKYNAQLDLYALMLNRWSKLDVIKTCLYFIRNGLLIEQEMSSDIIRKTESQLQDFIQS
ncbi:MAG: UvrD-helicase domain-containing protein [Candidatus Marinimicrobia bacterium]|nr:UvrD-helicase domain-containing protein [Candidatus Neomarinimicrobiota bacterium]